jgi:hypothetical protein
VNEIAGRVFNRESPAHGREPKNRYSAEVIRLMKKQEFPKLYGWDDGSIYFMDDNHHQWCVTDEKELYDRLVRLCKEYFAGKK